jgi:hypothetical protein
MLQKFHRGTVEVIKQNEGLSQELSSLKSAHEAILEEKTLSEQLNGELSSKIRQLEETVERSGHDLAEAHETIDKLQIKCANLIKEKQELLRRQESETEEWTLREERSQVLTPFSSPSLDPHPRPSLPSSQSEIVTLRRELAVLEEESQQAKAELQQTRDNLTAMTSQNQQQARDLEASQSAIQEAKAMISTAQRENEIAVKAFHDSDRGNKLQITTLQEQLRDKIKEMEDLQAMHTARIEEKNQREREFQQSILTKDDRIREVSEPPSCVLPHLGPPPPRAWRRCRMSWMSPREPARS